MFTSTVSWQAWLSRRVSNRTIRRRPSGLRTIRPLSFRTTCTMDQYQAHSLLGYVQGLGLESGVQFQLGVNRHGSLRSAMVPAYFSRLFCYERLRADGRSAYRTGIESSCSRVADGSSFATAFWRRSSFHQVRGSAPIPRTCLG